MTQTSTNITQEYCQKTRYNYVRSSVFFASNCSPLLCYRSVTTALTAQIPAETLSQSHRLCFIGKERDSETGFSYFGARYYDSDILTGWLSVDPMADKYPSLSPYSYCGWNPIRLVDPDGKDIWELNSTGNIVNRISDNNYDQIRILDSKGKITYSSFKFEYGTISELKLSNQNATAFEVCGSKNAEEIFEFLASYYTKDNGVPMEWGHATLNSTDDISIIGTNHKPKSISLLRELTDEGYSVTSYVHNHPYGNPTPSGSVGANGKDLGNAPNHEKKHQGIKLYTYTPKIGYTRYSSIGILDLRILTQPHSTLGWNKKQ